jgi:hypothetical protein
MQAAPENHPSRENNLFHNYSVAPTSIGNAASLILQSPEPRWIDNGHFTATLKQALTRTIC